MILAVKLDGSYGWQCEDCGAERNEYPHRGPRNSLCKRCQNIRYRAGRSPARVAFERMGAARRNRAYRQRRQEGGWGRGEVSAPDRPGHIPVMLTSAPDGGLFAAPGPEAVPVNPFHDGSAGAALRPLTLLLD